MQLTEFIESKLEYLQSKPILALSIVMLFGLSLRVYFTPWHLSTESHDAFIFMIEGVQYSKGDFSSLGYRFLWPMFLSVFFLIFRFDSYFEYMTLVRIISIVISTLSIPVLYLISKQFVGVKYAVLATVFFYSRSKSCRKFNFWYYRTFIHFAWAIINLFHDTEK